MSGTDRWLKERISRVPEALARRLDRDEEAHSTAAALLERGLAALARTEEVDPGDREGAYCLLAADAYLTYACEAAAESADPEATLEELLDRLRAGAA